jgi:rubrerythrin
LSCTSFSLSEFRVLGGEVTFQRHEGDKAMQEKTPREHTDESRQGAQDLRDLTRAFVMEALDENLNGASQFLEEAVLAYKAMLESAEGPARGLIDQFLRTSRNHLGLLGKSPEREVSAYQVCQICGFIAREKVPDHCPVCRALPEKFQRVE